MVEAAAAKDLRRLGRADQQRLLRAIHGLPAGDVKRLVGNPGAWRLRVGDWRAIFHRDDEQRTIVVLAVRPRGDAYRP